MSSADIGLSVMHRYCPAFLPIYTDIKTHFFIDYDAEKCARGNLYWYDFRLVAITIKLWIMFDIPI